MTINHVPLTHPFQWLLNAFNGIVQLLKLLLVLGESAYNTPISTKRSDPIELIETSKTRHMRHFPPM